MPTVPRRNGRPKLSLTMTAMRLPLNAPPAAPQGFGRGVRVERQQQHPFAALVRGDIGMVDAGIGHDPAEAVLGDHQVRAMAHDARAIPTG